MKVIVFDTETTGLPQHPSGQKMKSFLENQVKFWPHIIQFSYIIYDVGEHKLISAHDDILCVPSEIDINEEAFKLHGISKEKSLREGKDYKEVLEAFMLNLVNVDLVIGHNVAFDLNMLKAELVRLHCSEHLTTLKHLQMNSKFYCTQMKTTKYCNIKSTSADGREFVKWPKLSELHKVIFDEIPPLHKLHNSLIDCVICLRCYVHLEHKHDVYKNQDIVSIVI
tara:strand:- start:2144 stop:2815 length:672 start_codon:yes stop_codon:yes gene_type:complete